jgi:hypothetical protein
MEKRRILSIIVGITQGIIGIFFAIIVIFLVLNIIEFQSILNPPSEFIPLYVIILSLFVVFSAVSGLSLVCEGRK